MIQNNHVTEYTAVTTGEDFAEIFWLYLKSKGKLPRFYDTAPIRRKWKFLGELGKGEPSRKSQGTQVDELNRF